MPDDPPVADASAPATCTFTPDELDMPVGLIEDLDGCSRPIWDGASSSRCVWHADGADKPPDELAATVEDGDLSGARVRESDLTDVPFPKGSRLIGADLAGALLNSTDLAGADFSLADLTDADLTGADLTNTTLASADLTNATLGGGGPLSPTRTLGGPPLLTRTSWEPTSPRRSSRVPLSPTRSLGAPTSPTRI